MRRLCAVALWAIVALTAKDIAPEPLTNDDVLGLVKAGFADSAVIQAIRVSETRFDRSPDALNALRRAGVSDSVIEAIQKPWRERPHIRLLEPGVYVTHEDAYALVNPERVSWRAAQVSSPAESPGIRRIRLSGLVENRSSHQYLSNSAVLLIVCEAGHRAAEYQLLRADLDGDRRDFRTEAAVRSGNTLALAGVEPSIPRTDIETNFDLGLRIRLRSLPRGEYGLVPPGLVANGRLAPTGLIHTFTIE